MSTQTQIKRLPILVEEVLAPRLQILDREPSPILVQLFQQAEAAVEHERRARKPAPTVHEQPARVRYAYD